MRDTDLPSPNIGSRGHHLRRVASQAISQLQIAAPGYGGTHPAATSLRAFFSAAADALIPLDATPANENDA
jgi:hypothetical protein